MSEGQFETAAIIGLGLMGASLAAAFKKNNAVNKVIGYDCNPETIKKASQLEFIDEQFLGTKSDYKNLKTADIVIIAVPVKKIPEILADIKGKAARDSMVIDVGSSKSFVMKEAAKIFSSPPEINFIGGHPLCGSEKSGIDNYNPELFQNQKMILTPVRKLYRNTFDQLQLVNFFSRIGLAMKSMRPEEHDRKMAYISHLPQIGASSLALVLEGEEDLGELLQLAGTGFADTTRLAGSDPDMWRDIVLTNRENIVSVIAQLQEILQELRNNLENNNKDEILRFFQEAVRLRNEFISRKGD